MLVRPRLPLAVLTVAAVSSLSIAAASPAAERAAPPRLASATGQTSVAGVATQVDVLVAVPSGASARAAARKALAAQRARPARRWAARAAFAFTGLRWDRRPVAQSYNPRLQPLDAYGALLAAQATWSSVPGADFAFAAHGLTARCPSLTTACPRRGFDGFNDVGWAPLPAGTLAVTWSGAVFDEADVVLGTGVPWSATCGPATRAADLETVLLHEEGHVAGLDHTDDLDTIMFPSYRGAHCGLGADDEDGLRALYPGA